MFGFHRLLVLFLWCFLCNSKTGSCRDDDSATIPVYALAGTNVTFSCDNGTHLNVTSWVLPSGHKVGMDDDDENVIKSGDVMRRIRVLITSSSLLVLKVDFVSVNVEGTYSCIIVGSEEDAPYVTVNSFHLQVVAPPTEPYQCLLLRMRATSTLEFLCATDYTTSDDVNYQLLAISKNGEQEIFIAGSTSPRFSLSHVMPDGVSDWSIQEAGRILLVVCVNKNILPEVRACSQPVPLKLESLKTDEDDSSNLPVILSVTLTLTLVAGLTFGGVLWCYRHRLRSHQNASAKQESSFGDPQTIMSPPQVRDLDSTRSFNVQGLIRDTSQRVRHVRADSPTTKLERTSVRLSTSLESSPTIARQKGGSLDVDRTNQSGPTQQSDQTRPAQQSDHTRLAQQSDQTRLAQQSDHTRLTQQSDHTRLTQQSDHTRLTQQSDHTRLTQQSDHTRLTQQSDHTRLTQQSDQTRLTQQFATTDRRENHPTSPTAVTKSNVTKIDPGNVPDDTKAIRDPIHRSQREMKRDTKSRQIEHKNSGIDLQIDNIEIDTAARRSIHADERLAFAKNSQSASRAGSSFYKLFTPSNRSAYRKQQNSELCDDAIEHQYQYGSIKKRERTRHDGEAKASKYKECPPYVNVDALLQEGASDVRWKKSSDTQDSPYDHIRVERHEDTRGIPYFLSSKRAVSQTRGRVTTATQPFNKSDAVPETTSPYQVLSSTRNDGLDEASSVGRTLSPFAINPEQRVADVPTIISGPPQLLPKARRRLDETRGGKVSNQNDKRVANHGYDILKFPPKTERRDNNRGFFCSMNPDNLPRRQDASKASSSVTCTSSRVSHSQFLKSSGIIPPYHSQVPKSYRVAPSDQGPIPMPSHSIPSRFDQTTKSAYSSSPKLLVNTAGTLSGDEHQGKPSRYLREPDYDRVMTRTTQSPRHFRRKVTTTAFDEANYNEDIREDTCSTRGYGMPTSSRGMSKSLTRLDYEDLHHNSNTIQTSKTPNRSNLELENTEPCESIITETIINKFPPSLPPKLTKKTRISSRFRPYHEDHDVYDVPKNVSRSTPDATTATGGTAKALAETASSSRLESSLSMNNYSRNDTKPRHHDDSTSDRTSRDRHVRPKPVNESTRWRDVPSGNTRDDKRVLASVSPQSSRKEFDRRERVANPNVDTRDKNGDPFNRCKDDEPSSENAHKVESNFATNYDEDTYYRSGRPVYIYMPRRHRRRRSRSRSATGSSSSDQSSNASSNPRSSVSSFEETASLATVRNSHQRSSLPVPGISGRSTATDRSLSKERLRFHAIPRVDQGNMATISHGQSVRHRGHIDTNRLQMTIGRPGSFPSGVVRHRARTQSTDELDAKRRPRSSNMAMRRSRSLSSLEKERRENRRLDLFPRYWRHGELLRPKHTTQV